MSDSESRAMSEAVHVALVLDLNADNREEFEQLVSLVKSALAGHPFGHRLQATAFADEAADHLQQEVGFVSDTLRTVRHL